MDLWLIGAGPMALAYHEVLKGLGRDFLVLGRGAASAAEFTGLTGTPVYLSGFKYLAKNFRPPERAIISVGVADLAQVAGALLDLGVKNLLLEKPGGVDLTELEALEVKRARFGARILLAYNRRFYGSVRTLRRLAAEEGGIGSIHFEFTEWGHTIDPEAKSAEVMARWLLANSSHVLDLAFFLGGPPVDLAVFQAGSLGWHQPAVFSGAGRTAAGALFSYQANWKAPGRWGLEACTPRRRYVLRPLEELQQQELGQLTLTTRPPEDDLDQRYKPGLYRQVAAFLSEDDQDFCSLEQQVSLAKHYYQIAGWPTPTER